MLPGRHFAGHEDAEMTDALVEAVYDGLPVCDQIVEVLVEIENPAERLLRRGDVVAERAEDDDRRLELAQIDARAFASGNLTFGQLVPDEQFVDDELDFIGVQENGRAPPFLEFEKARRLSVDLGIDVVILGPERVRRVVGLEIGNQRGAVENAVAQIAREGGEP